MRLHQQVLGQTHGRREHGEAIKRYVFRIGCFGRLLWPIALADCLGRLPWPTAQKDLAARVRPGRRDSAMTFGFTNLGVRF